MPTCGLCGACFRNTVKIEGKIRNLSSRKYCLDCSPFGLHNTKQLVRLSNLSGFHFCPMCKENKPLAMFYKRRGGKPSSYCKPCDTMRVFLKQKNNKLQAIEYKGGSCQECHYSRYFGALEFHHKNPEHKDAVVARLLRRVGFAKAREEIDKCALLCSNCHRIAHYDPNLKVTDKALYLREIKRKAVAYMGGCCVLCGFNGYQGVFDFHHRNPTEKDFQISKTTKKWDKILTELKKCEIVCACCHAEVHGGIKHINQKEEGTQKVPSSQPEQ